MARLKWGILSTAKIGLDLVIPGIQGSALNEVVAIASRDGARARAAADRLGIARHYGSYEALLDDADIDIIYNPLPNQLHVPLSRKALDAGKHVLCEKPFAMTAQEASELLGRPEKPYIMEAFMVRFHPQWLRAKEIVESGEIGEVKNIQTTFAYYNTDPKNIRNIAETGGGAVYDIGCYAIVAARFFFGAEPQRVVSIIDRDPTFKTDRLTSTLMDFGNGRQSSWCVSTQHVPFQRINIFGAKKRLEIVIPFNAPIGEETLIRLDDGTALDLSSAKPETIRACDQYGEEADAFARMVLGEEPPIYGVADAVQNMKIIDAVYRSGESGAWEEV